MNFIEREGYAPQQRLLQGKLLPALAPTDLKRGEIALRVPLVSEVILNATIAPNRNIDNSIKKIDIGDLVYEAQLLKDFGTSGFNPMEIDKPILIKNSIFEKNEKAVIKCKPRLDVSGGSLEIEMHIVADAEQRRTLPREQRQDGFVAAILHARPVEIPPLPTDITHILLDDIECVYAGTSVIVSGPQFNHVIFRGPDTPSLNQNEASDFEKKWDGIIKERFISKFGDDIAKEKPARSSGNKYKSDQEWVILEAIIQKEILNEIIKEYGLIAFTGRADDRIVSRVTG